MRFSRQLVNTYRTGNRRGAMLVLVGVSMVALLGLVALSADIGAGNRVRRISQTAVDAAALGGGNEIMRSSSSAAVVAAAVAAYNKAGNPVPGAVLSVHYPPLTGTYAGNNRFIEVTLARTIPTMFGGILGRDSLAVFARGVAGAAAGSQVCVLGLSNSGSAIDIKGDIDAGSPGSGCSVVSNSGIEVKNGGKLTGGSISAVGGISIGPPGSSTPEYPGIPPVPDPLAYLTAPAETSCPPALTNFKVSGTMNLSPGVYCGGIDFQGGNGKKAILAAGTYILRGGGIKGGKNELEGTNVTIINTNGPGNDPTKFAPFEFEQNCLVNLTAPTSNLDPYRGIVLFAPVNTPFAVNTFCGVGDLTGTVYMPSQEFMLANGNGKLTIIGSLYAGTITTENAGGKYEIISDMTSIAAVKRLSLVQ